MLTIIVIGDGRLLRLHGDGRADTPEGFLEFIQQRQTHDTAILVKKKRGYEHVKSFKWKLLRIQWGLIYYA